MSFERPTLDDAERETRNYAGGRSYKSKTPQNALYTLVTANLVEDTYYRSEEDGLAELADRFAAAAQEEPEFPLQLGVYARQNLGQREVAQFLLLFASHHDQTQEYVRDYAPEIIQRADEPCTLLELHDEYYEGTAPKPLRKGIEDALHNFNAYHFAKYDSNRRDVNLRDVVNRVHPKPKDEQHDEIFERLIRGPLSDYPEVEPLETPDTWETALSTMPVASFESDPFTIPTDAEGEIASVSGTGLNDQRISVSLEADGETAELTLDAANGTDVENVRVHIQSVTEEPRYSGFGIYDRFEHAQDSVPVPLPIRLFRDNSPFKAKLVVKESDKQAAWEEALPDMGLFARIRNIRNMVYAGVDDEDIFDDGDLEHVQESQILPFRFYQAYRALEEEPIDAPAAKAWLAHAVEAGVAALPNDLEDTFVAVDLSGSMRSPVAGNSEFQRISIACLFGGLLMKKGADVSVFGRRFSMVDEVEEKTAIELADHIHDYQSNVGANGTNGHLVMQHLTQENSSYNRIVFLTDEQLWDTSRRDNSLRDEVDTYRSVVDQTPIHIIDLASYGNLTMPEGYEKVYRMSGWSEDVLKFFDYAENTDAHLERVREVSPTDN